MMIYKKFDENDIPYDIFEKFGVTQQMVDDLPEREMKKLLGGLYTTDIPIVCPCGDGTSVKAKAAMKLVRNANGGTDVLVAARLKKNELTGFSDEEIDKLRAGKVILSKDGNRYVQLDDVSNMVMSESAELVKHNINIFKKYLELDDNAANEIINGETVTIGDKDNPFSIGVDLHNPNGIHHIEGDKKMWELTKNGERLPHHVFGLYGCWVTDNDGSLDHYVLEDKYTKDMEDELRKMSERNMDANRDGNDNDRSTTTESENMKAASMRY